MGPVVPADSWTHVAVTYHLDHGLRLYTNGSLYNASDPISFVASSKPNYLFVGSPLKCGDYLWWSEIKGQYWGAVEELQVYSRELTADEINVLANL